jgi:RNA polymerase sigma-70 factor, ECF subfamily
VDPRPGTPLVDDSELVARVLAGEREAFHVLLQRHSAALLATLGAFLGNRDDAREVFQETWLRAYQHLARLREPARVRAWLVSIALNLARARRRRPLEQVLEGEPAFTLAEGGELERDEELAALRHHVAALPARQREVVDLRVNHELTHAEIAGLLGISEEASRANYYQGLKRLKDAMGERARR